MIPDFKTYLRESVWSDMHRRSTGKTARKEDTLDDIFNYLNTQYVQAPLSGEEITYEDGRICVPLFVCPFLNAHCDLNISNCSYIIFSTINPNKYDLSDTSSVMKSTIRTLKPVLNGLYEKINDKYTVVDISEFSGLDHWYDIKIKPKDGSSITRQFCVELIDFILDTNNIGKKIKPSIKKK